MAKIKKSAKNLQYKIWIILSFFSAVHLFIIFLEKTFFTSSQNNFLSHLVYNITSIFAIFPGIILLKTKIVSEGLDPTGRSLIILFLFCLLFNFLISKILVSKSATNLYKDLIEPNKQLVKIILVIIVLAFAFL